MVIDNNDNLNPYKNILLFGGGLDSYSYSLIMSYFNIPHILYHIDYGQIASNIENKAINSIYAKYKDTVQFVINPTANLITKDNPLLGNKNYDTLNTSTAFILGRNLQFIQNVINYCINNSLNTVNIFLGFTDPGYAPMPDATPEFVSAVDTVISSSYTNNDLGLSYHVYAPLQYCSRFDVVQAAYYIDKTLFDKAMTCWVPVNGEECQKCPHCLAKKDLRIKVNDIRDNEFFQKMKNLFLSIPTIGL